MSGKAKPLLYDKQIIDRVEKCLVENSAKNIPDLGTVSHWLQAKYPEYRRRRQGPFRQLVKQAYRIVYDSLYEQLSSPESGSSSETEQVAESAAPQRNVLNNLFQNMYKANKPMSKSTEKGNTDAISISSSEDEDGSKTSKSDLPHNEDSNSNPPPTAPPPPVIAPVLTPAPSIAPIPLPELQSLPKYVPKETAPFDLPNPPIKRKVASFIGQAKQKQRKFKKRIYADTPKLNFENVAGIDDILKRLCEELFNVVAPEYYLHLGAKPPNGILIYGQTGCGKTTLAEAIAGQIEFQYINVPATELIAGVSGESEERIREVFEQAISYAPCVLFIDGIDAIGTNRAHAQKDMQSRITSQLINCLDTLKAKSWDARILVIGATNCPDALDPALRRPGRFDQEISIPVPDRKGRFQIIEKLCRDLAIEKGFDFDKIAELTPGYVAADIAALIARAGALAVKRVWSKKLYEIQNTDNISTIDLDDENTNPNGSKTVKEPEQPTTAETSSISNQEAKSECDANKPSSDASTENIAEEQIEEKMSESDPTEKVVEENVGINKKNSKTKTSKPSAMPPPDWQPSLRQLLNWLENPPDDLQNFDNFCFTMKDFLEALKVLQPSAKREGFVTVPDVTWDDIGSLHEVREQLRLAILAPVKYPKAVQRLGLDGPGGVLLCGPPGCGKTLIAKAIANEAGTNFISVKGPEMMNMYVGESERAVRECFQRARNSAPCVIFFDEFDSLCPKRSNSTEGTSGVRIVNQLLTEMDGVEERKGVYVLAATNRPDIIDPAILRPGRLDNILYIGMPDLKARCEILNAITKNGKIPVMSKEVKFEEIALLTDGYTGADLGGLIRQASQMALRNALENDTPNEELCVTADNIKDAIKLTRPSISEHDRKIYEDLRLKYGSNLSS